MNPYVDNQSGLIAGDLLSRIGQRIEQRADENKRILQAGKAADAFFKALPEGNRPVPIEEWNLQSPMDKASAMTGFIGSQHYQKGQEDLLDALTQRKGREATQANAAKLPAFYGDVARYNQPGQLPYNVPVDEFNQFALPEGQTQPGLRELTSSAARTGYELDPRTLGDLMRAPATAGGAGAHPHFFDPSQAGLALDVKTQAGEVLPGHRLLVTGPNTSQALIEQSAGPEPQYDKNGVLLGHVIHTGGKTGTFQKVDLPSTLTAAQRIHALTQQYSTMAILGQTNQANEVHQQIQKLLNPKPEESSAKMVDLKGNTVLVPRARLSEFKRKGYQMSP